MKKYSYCFLLFIVISLICAAAGYGITKYGEQKGTQPEGGIENAETILEPYVAESPEDNQKSVEEAVEPANQKPQNKYYLVSEDGFLLVFCGDRTTVCLYTHVPITDFPEEEQDQLRAGIWFSSMMDIFSYLESYTS
ncbi:hypothetical protein AALB16_04690 [Lachnospiraceae bacterium 62-35]